MFKKKLKEKSIEKKVEKKAVEKKYKIIKTTDPKEFDRLVKEGCVIVDIHDEIKGNYYAETIPKTYTVKKEV